MESELRVKILLMTPVNVHFFLFLFVRWNLVKFNNKNTNGPSFLKLHRMQLVSNASEITLNTHCFCVSCIPSLPSLSGKPKNSAKSCNKCAITKHSFYCLSFGHSPCCSLLVKLSHLSRHVILPVLSYWCICLPCWCTRFAILLHPFAILLYPFSTLL